MLDLLVILLQALLIPSFTLSHSRLHISHFLMASVTIFDIKRFAIHDGPGIRTTVFMKGCPMDCWWCHNPESRRPEPQEVTYNRKLGEKEVESKKVYGKSMSTQQLMHEILKDKLFFEESGGGVTFSGGEPLYQPEALINLLKSCSDYRLHTTVDTCGYAQWKVFERILPYTDLFLFDLKLLDPGKHEKYTGVKNRLILENLEKLIAAHAKVEVRIPVIPGINNDGHELDLYMNYLPKFNGKITKIHLLAYHEIAETKYKKLNLENRMKALETKHSMEIQSIQKAFENIGFEVGIGG